ncbi:MAG: type III-A CRISPR-associated protein Csm2 [Halobacteriota archaeon]
MYRQNKRRDDFRQETEIEKIIQKIGNLQNLSQLDEKDIAEEGGYAEQIAKAREVKDLKTTQLRKFFSEIKVNERKLKEKGWDGIKADFYMMRPNLAYAKARKLVPDPFFKLINACMKQVDKGDDEQKKENYKRFVQFLEAIIAYHKYYHGGS